VPVEGDPADLLTQARRYAVAAGARVFRFYLGPRFPSDYRPVVADPALSTIIMTVYTSRDYGAGLDDLNLNRPWSEADAEAERRQITWLCEDLYERFGQSPKTVILTNSEADEKLLEIMNYTASPERAIENLVAWTNTRHRAIAAARRPHARLRIVHGFEISLVNLAIGPDGAGGFRKSPNGRWNALRDVVPRVRFDVLLNSTYESINSPYETQDINTDPALTGVRLRRDLDRIQRAARGSLSDTGRLLYGDRFIAAGELGFARDRFERLPTGGVLPRLMSALRAAIAWGCPYIVLWQVFDAPRAPSVSGAEQYGFGMIGRDGHPPRLRPVPSGCDSIRSCLAILLGERSSPPLAGGSDRAAQPQ
jgi:hypothetical protein